MIGLINTWLYNYIWSGSKVWSRNQVIQSPTYWSYIGSWIQICPEINLVCCFCFYLCFFCLNSGCRGKGLAFIPCLQGGEHVSYFLFLELKFRIVGAMSLGLKVDVCFSNLPKKLTVVVFGSSFLFLKFLIHFSRFPKILLALSLIHIWRCRR